MLRVENEAQLATVLAHEIGHYLQRHTLERLRDARSRAAFGTFMAMFGLVGAVGQLAAVAGSFGFSRDQERDADRIGLTLMERAGYDPREASRVWDNLIAELAANPEADPTRSNPLFATHPPSAERSQALAERARGRSGELGQAGWAARVAPLRFELLADELGRARFDETLVLLERMVRREPGQAELLYYRGETRRQRARDGDFASALDDFQAAVGAGGEPAVTHRSLGYLLRELKRPDDAREAFARYLQKAPDAPDAALIRSYVDDRRPA
jgi:predicted Zn-dependent protease